MTDAPELSETETLQDGLERKPLHEQVKERILRRIILGTWTEGHVLPPELELAKQFNVSYGTIRRAMSDLTASGVIMRRRKTGTVVTGRTPHHSMSQFYQYYRLHTIEGRLSSSRTVLVDACHRRATLDESERLDLPAKAPVIYMHRLRLIEDRPVMIDRVTIPLALAPDFPVTIEEMPTLIYKWLLEHHGLRLAAVREKLIARLATPEDLDYLDLPRNAPRALLDIDEVSYDSSNRPLVAMRHAALTEDHCYINELR
ncbi:GntR family transcriptional regulator [Salipiger sp. 1_MG-2023]|uniref:GntR family transcriptional regulator n=1 Tax=Salipiger sp. 1_MG-2023 TaxID=3062665 RepID=UPI0026E1829C|nr:GntR family transcriptional regulator [Salipiger sp. 1_MG-2023]MDO6587971.1 GntR family transcriptional regulator [Salipiger sp. 1_MG-2023]